MPLLKRALIATLVAWFVGVLFYPWLYWISAKLHHGVNPPLSVSYFLVSSGLALFFVAVRVFPTCLLVVTPLLKLLPSTSYLWHPLVAASVGAFGGPLATYVWWCLGAGGSTYAQSAFNFPDGKAEMFTSVAVGIAFGYVVARLRAPRPNHALQRTAG